MRCLVLLSWHELLGSISWVPAGHCCGLTVVSLHLFNHWCCRLLYCKVLLAASLGRPWSSSPCGCS